MNIFFKQLANSFLPGNMLRPISGMLFFLLFLCNVWDLSAQRLAIRTNVPEWVVSSPNLGVEFSLNKKLSLDITGAGCPFGVKNDIYFKHIRGQSELKYWFENILYHHYVGIMGFYSSFDIGYKKRGYFGDSCALGLTYGYNWIISRRWNIELSAGLGIIHYRIDRYIPTTPHCQPNESGWTAAPVKLGISFVYIVK